MNKLIAAISIIGISLAFIASATTYTGSTSTDIGNIADNPSNFSVQATINISSAITGRHYAIVCKGNWSSGTTPSYCLYLSPSPTSSSTGVRVRWQLSDGANWYYNDGGTTIVNDGQDHVVKGTWDGTALHLYVDGVEEGSIDGSTPTSGFSNSAHVTIGDTSDHANTREFIGTITNTIIKVSGTTVYDDSTTPTPTVTPTATPSECNNSTTIASLNAEITTLQDLVNQLQ